MSRRAEPLPRRVLCKQTPTNLIKFSVNTKGVDYKNFNGFAKRSNPAVGNIALWPRKSQPFLHNTDAFKYLST